MEEFCDVRGCLEILRVLPLGEEGIITAKPRRRNP